MRVCVQVRVYADDLDISLDIFGGYKIAPFIHELLCFFFPPLVCINEFQPLAAINV